METKSLEPLLAEHPFFSGMLSEHRELIAGCATNVRFDAGQQVMREGDPADHFFVIRRGRIAVEIYAPQRGGLTIQTLDDGDVLGFSAMFAPYRWRFDARAVQLTRALAFDAKCLRGKSEADVRLGYELTTRFARVMLDRLEATQLQLLDLYGDT